MSFFGLPFSPDTPAGSTSSPASRTSTRSPAITRSFTVRVGYWVCWHQRGSAPAGIAAALAATTGAPTAVMYRLGSEHADGACDSPDGNSSRFYLDERTFQAFCPWARVRLGAVYRAPRRVCRYVHGMSLLYSMVLQRPTPWPSVAGPLRCRPSR
jgi:hypothetical protein